MNQIRYKKQQILNSTMLTNECGRSMIEMLGVLAIIGVLSVGGIAGYTTAMRSYKANEIVNATSMLYMMGISSNAGAGDATLTYTGSFGNQLSDLKEITYASGTLTVQITDAGVCSQVMSKLGSKATGDCTTASDGAYALTVTLGETPAGTPSCEGNVNCENGKKKYECDMMNNTLYNRYDDSEVSGCNYCMWNKDNTFDLDGYFQTDAEALAALCDDGGWSTYDCISGTIWTYDNNGTAVVVTGCSNCSASSRRYFRSDAEAIATLCDD